MHGKWIRRISLPRELARTALICFPHVGGSATYFAPLARCIDPAIEPLSVQYPGRQDRRHDEWAGSIDELVDGVLGELPGTVEGRAVALYGHSMGAIVAFEVCRRLPEFGVTPQALFLSGRRSPRSTRKEHNHTYTEAELATELRLVADTAPTWLADPELRELLLPVVRRDYRAIESYVYTEGRPVACPIVVLTGDDDPYVDVDEAKDWESFTTGDFALHAYQGKHFFMESNLPAVGQLMSETLARLN
ncbi:hypothetical protein BOX37_32245 [Nocardia mangyaensis]|uniref:Thioesterase TesA n=1 Tax=Nocardia mangyaensis TaxID=2213200 RepID=A0A1J0W0V2_9NOCA|nr:alpha/beta fold hydrolase [Nocardia mangyaensis]APE37833.1 hypothetical protein BOX37_32245 [Nocardia mangyaensis]